MYCKKEVSSWDTDQIEMGRIEDNSKRIKRKYMQRRPYAEYVESQWTSHLNTRIRFHRA